MDLYLLVSTEGRFLEETSQWLITLEGFRLAALIFSKKQERNFKISSKGQYHVIILETVRCSRIRHLIDVFGRHLVFRKVQLK